MIDEVLERNARYAESFDTGGASKPSRCRPAVVACMDARLISPLSQVRVRVGSKREPLPAQSPYCLVRRLGINSAGR